MLGGDKDILLLDISNNDEYIWTTTFEPSPPPVSSSPPPLSTQPINTNTNTQSQPTNTGAIVGAFIGSLIGGISLTVGSFFLYKRYKNKRQISGFSATGEIPNYPPEILQIPGASQIQPTYN